MILFTKKEAQLEKSLVAFTLLFCLLSKTHSLTINAVQLKEVDVESVETVGSAKSFIAKLNIEPGFGQENKFGIEIEYRFKEAQGKTISFHFMIDVLNFMANNGCELVRPYIVTAAGHSVYPYPLRKRSMQGPDICRRRFMPSFKKATPVKPVRRTLLLASFLQIERQHLQERSYLAKKLLRSCKLGTSTKTYCMQNAGNIAPSGKEAEQKANEKFAKGLARAFGGALIFSLPVLMTMEMWWLGFYMNNGKLALFLLLIIPFLTGLSYFVGFENTFRLKDDALDAFVAYAIGFTTAVVILYIFSVIDWGMPLGEVIGKVSLQAIPCSIGALFAKSQLGGQQPKQEEANQSGGYAGEVFIMLAGALYLSFSLAPTQEMELIAYKMNSWHLLGLIFVSLVIMHAFVYTLSFKGRVTPPKGVPFRSLFLRYTVVGYAVSLLVSFYILWTFGRTTGMSLYQSLNCVIVLGFPASVGAAAARLIL